MQEVVREQVLNLQQDVLSITGETVYEKTVNVFLHDKRCEEIIIVCKKEEQSHFKNY